MSNTTKKPRAKFSIFGFRDTGDVILEYTDEDGDRITRQFSCPLNGGYVYEINPNTLQRWQICKGLYGSGNCLESRAGGETLLNVIRREYKKFRRDEKRNSRTW